MSFMSDTFFYLSCQHSWVEYFTYLALGVSMRSKDPKTQVGCVIVDSETLKVSIQYEKPFSFVIKRET